MTAPTAGSAATAPAAAPPTEGGGWQARLSLDYRRQGERTLVHDRHSGPLRVLKSLHPERSPCCHSVLVHPPGGIVGGDELDVRVTLAANAHALVTTPGATRFYRSAGASARQTVRIDAAAGARVEWLPLETIAYAGCLAENRVVVELADDAEAIGWDVLALGLPASARPFASGRITAGVELPGRWLERGAIDAGDARLLDSPLGFAGHRVLATMWFAAGGALAEARRDALLDDARGIAADDPLRRSSGATSPAGGVVALRALADRVEPAMTLLGRVWAAWRETAWQLRAVRPRVWST